MTPVMIKGLGHRRSGMLKSYSVEHILLTLSKFFFFKWIYVSGYHADTPITIKAEAIRKADSHSHQYS